MRVNAVTVKQLRAILEKMPEDMVICRPSHDHKYSALCDAGLVWVEDIGEWGLWAEPEDEDGPGLIPIMVVE